MVLMAGAIVVGAIVLVFGFILFVFWAMNSRWAGERGWVYNRHTPRPRGTGSLGVLESIYQPSIEHVIEEQHGGDLRVTDDETGEKRVPGLVDLEEEGG